jgi:hypothetical protein
MIDPNEVVMALMCKWIISACEPGLSNFKYMLRFRLSQFQPYSGGRWEPNPNWFTFKSYSDSRGSDLWGRTTKAWKNLVGELRTVPPRSYEEWLSASIWWTSGFKAIGPGFSKTRAAALSRNGLQFVRNVWSQYRLQLWSGEEVREQFGLRPAEFMAWNAVTLRIANIRRRFWLSSIDRPAPEKWVGIYNDPTDLMPSVVVQGNELSMGINGVGWQNVELIVDACTYVVLPNSRSLTPVPQNPPSPVLSMQQGFLERVRVEQVITGPKKKKILLFYGKVKDLRWDPGRVLWSNSKPLMSYSTRWVGRC